MLQQNKRRFPRFSPKDVTFVALRPDFSHFGKVLDISNGGLRFQFMGAPLPPEKGRRLTLDLFVRNNGYYLPEVPCEVVYENREEPSEEILLATCHFGLRFTNLTREQIEKIGQYIEIHTSGPVG